MLIFDEKISSDSVPAWDHLAEKHGREKVLMFDLETTGFSPVNSFIYIIGINLWKEDSWHIIQLFNDDGKSEPEMIAHFMELLENKTTLFHFNGDRFDIPFVLGRMEKIKNSLKISIPDRMSPLDSVDFFKEIKPFKYALGLPNVKQKTVEKYLGIYREDQYDGGTLINVYRNYCRYEKEDDLKLLLLHNLEDVKGMLSLPSFYAYLHLFDCDVKTLRAASEDVPGSAGRKDAVIHFEPGCSLPSPLSAGNAIARIQIKGSEGLLRLPVLSCVMYYFFPDPANYYYLPEEDRAVHKSVGAYVDREHRRQAVAQTCYVKKSGCFLPQASPVFSPSFRREYDDPVQWVQEELVLEADTEQLREYLRGFLNLLF